MELQGTTTFKVQGQKKDLEKETEKESTRKEKKEVVVV